MFSIQSAQCFFQTLDRGNMVVDMPAQNHGRGHHVFTVVSGFGLRVIPRAPYRVFHGPNAQELDVHHDIAGGSQFARLIADGLGGYKSKIDQHTASLYDVLEVEDGPVPGGWQIDTGMFRAAFPTGFALHSVSADSTSPFELVGAGPSLISMQSPLKVPPPSAMCGPGQQVSKSGDDWVELVYEHEGKRWWQRHQIVNRLIFSTQAPSEAQNVALTGLRTLLDSLVMCI